jgi:transposase InsO family protein
MHPELTIHFAHERHADLLRAASLRRRARVATSRRPQAVRAAIELRLSACREELERLAALSERRFHAGEWIVADVNGVPVAAVAVDDGTTIYDPFTPTSQAVSLLKLRRKQVLAAA